ncbi:hypothetical protein [Burkholderia sp. SIMBA_062]|uniref:hypothetical protein n=1 Tax=Burkholderia sp. SIMBA_062 TaxID=3085803 RepID=UPI00397C4561
MTSPTSVDIPAPADWQQFERLSRALFSEAFQAKFSRFGRGGQRQNGIDVLGRLRTGALIGVQCKGRASSMGKKLTQQQIDNAIVEAETFPDTLDELYIVTTANEDAVLQQYVIGVSGSRQAAGKFPVTLWGWQSMSDQIRSCPGVMETFYGQWWRKPSLKFIASAAFVATAVGVAGMLGSHRVEQWLAATDANRRTTVSGLQQVVLTLDELQDVYVKCVESMGGKAFVFYSQLQGSCIGPIKSALLKLGRQRDQMAGVMNTDAYTEVVTATDYLNADFRQLLIAADMELGFERSAVDYAKSACPNAKLRVGTSNDQSKLLRETGENALSMQMSQYFRMRDFAIPAISALKARLAAASRRQNGQGVPGDLVKEANTLPSLLQEERDFTYKLPASPFATARAKQMSARTLTVSGPALDPVDNAVWSYTAEEAMFEGLRGHKSDIEYLISCGLLKPEAKVLANDVDEHSQAR